MNFSQDQISITYFADAPQVFNTVSEWLYHEFLYLNPGQTIEMRREEMARRLHRDRVPFCMVAMINSIPVATASIIENDLPEKPEYTPWLASVFTEPSWRNKGIGGKMVRAVTREVFKQGKYCELYLYTPDQEEFYRKLGWQRIETIEHSGNKVVIMKTSA
ncbi:MAG: GNAT family N-acetyltransferase [Oligoflexales bacterium]|nr:GNAT family N-acetyltransferase [Oligoflexales bacterium]